MTAKLIHYFAFTLYSCLEMTVYKVWKTQGISFCEICKHHERVDVFKMAIVVRQW